VSIFYFYFLLNRFRQLLPQPPGHPELRWLILTIDRWLTLCTRSRYGRWKAQQAADEERRKSRAERRARGEDVSEDEESVDGPRDESLIMTLGKVLLLILIGTALAGQFITGSPLWGYKGKWTNLHTYLAPFTVSRFTNLTLRGIGL
jgi:hypothetical protein